MSRSQGIKTFEKILRKKKTFGIIGHFNPDGDSVGSVSAMYHFINQLGKESKVFLPSNYPSFLGFLDKNNDYKIYSKENEKIVDYLSSADVIICLDFNSLDRTENLKEIIKSSSSYKILIDHHPNPDESGFDLVFSTTETSSTCELLFWTLMQTKIVNRKAERMPFDSLEALATGMLTDTNNFNNSAISTTFEMASLLIKCGINLEQIGRTVFGSYSETRMKLMGKMLNENMTVIDDLNAAYMILTKEIQIKYDFQTGDSEGFVNLPLLIKGVEVSALFVENEKYVRVSLRSKGKYSVNDLCNQYFNGGGHFKAAGGRIYLPIEEVPKYFEDSFRAFINK